MKLFENSFLIPGSRDFLIVHYLFTNFLISGSLSDAQLEMLLQLVRTTTNESGGFQF